jgi:hypothetical protein
MTPGDQWRPDVPSHRVGRRVLVPFRDVDRFIQSRRSRTMATAHRTDALAPYVPPISAAELARRNRAAIELLDSWEADGDEQEQRETMAVLREALGEGRTLSARKLFP